MKLKVLLIGLVSISLLAACSGESTTEEMYGHLEEAVELENEFVSQQQPLNELEEQEQAIYQEITTLGMDDMETIISLADEALQSIEERKELLVAEKESIDASKEEFDKIEPLISDIEDETVQTNANEMYEIMEERYQAYINLHDTYVVSLENDQALYELLKQEELEEDAVTEQIDKVNAQYEKVIEANNTFSETTDAFNESKKTFYESTDLNVTYE
ncbi:YkyA family protein [Paraliobacillus sp. X-1268]|uniref:YkyA family protein n=1 Tax=Paraliobacillus sp. X-1268 TaxID=2213193 RepID=UPI000E3DE14D|nr:YkyA family protein [Paraliobacillus sp. X-1268]